MKQRVSHRRDLGGLPAYAAALNEARVHRNMTMRELLRRSGLASSTVNRILSGSRRVLLDHILNLAAALGVSLEVTAEGGLMPRKEHTWNVTLERTDEAAHSVVVQVRAATAAEARQLALADAKNIPANQWELVGQQEGDVSVADCVKEV